MIVQHWTTEDGLPSNALNRAMPAVDGYLWATSFGGLVRYDGRSFTILGQKDFPGLSTDGFNSLYIDRGGTMWVGTQGDGPWWYDGGRLHPLDPDSRQASEVISLLVDHRGDTWMGIETFKTFHYHSGGRTLLEHPSISGVVVQDLWQGRDGAIWFATWGKGVARNQEGRYSSFGPAEGLASPNATRLEEDHQGRLWVATPQGLSRIEGGRLTDFHELEGTAINDLLFDHQGTLWLATSRGLMRRRMDDGSYEVLREAAETPLNDLSSLSFDREGSLWVTSRIHGLFQFRQGKFTNYSTLQGLSTDRVHTIADGEEGGLLVGTDVGPFRVDPRGRVSPLRLRHALKDSRVMDFYTDSRGRRWISTYDGLLMIDGQDETFFGVEHGLPNPRVRWVREDSRGRLWVGSVAGVARWNEGGRFVVGELGPAVSGLSFSFAETTDGRLLIGTRLGLAVYSPTGEETLYRSGHELPGGLVFSTYVDARGKIWICTTRGLARLDSEGVKTLDRDSGLPVQSIYDYQEDSRGFVWLSSAVGVLRLSKQALEAFMGGETERVEVEVFDQRDGMLSPECTGARKIFRARDGRLWFPTLGGVAGIDPAQVLVNPVPPPVFITHLEADGEVLEAVEGMVIPPGRRRLSIAFTALSFQAPLGVRVRHRLEGFDPEWVESGADREVSYTNLAPGPYTLRVIAANYDGVWNHEGASFSFVVRPFVHQTLWFRLLLGILAVLAIGALYRWRMLAIQRHNTRLEADARERARLIEQLATKNKELELFAYTASHDLKNPLVTIEGFLGLVEKDALAGDVERMQWDMERIKTNVRTMDRLLDGLREISRIGRQADTYREVALADLAHRARSGLTEHIAQGRIEVVIDPELPHVSGSPLRLLQVFESLLANAVQFMGEQAEPRIEIGSRRQDSQRIVYVRDNGIGIEPQYHRKVFRLFDRLDPQGEGSGLGLAIVQRVIANHGGRIWVESEGQGQGSTFCFTLGRECWIGEG